MTFGIAITHNCPIHFLQRALLIECVARRMKRRKPAGRCVGNERTNGRSISSVTSFEAILALAYIIHMAEFWPTCSSSSDSSLLHTGGLELLMSSVKRTPNQHDTAHSATSRNLIKSSTATKKAGSATFVVSPQIPHIW